MRKEAVRKWGSGFMAMLNNVGGPGLTSALSGLAGVMMPRVGYRTGGAVTPQKTGGAHQLTIDLGGGSFDLFGAEDQIAGFMEAMERERLTSAGE